MKRKKAEMYTERQTVNLTAEQMRRLDELRLHPRAPVGKLDISNDLLREAVNHYLAAQDDLPGSRRACQVAGDADGYAGDESRYVTETLEDFIARVTKRRE